MPTDPSENFSIGTVRLACVRRAASVHPEPGSNSHFKVLLPRAPDPSLVSFLFVPCLLLLGSFTLAYFSEFLLKEFSGSCILFCLRLSRSCCRPGLGGNFYNLPHRSAFVNSFFSFFLQKFSTIIQAVEFYYNIFPAKLSRGFYRFFQHFFISAHNPRIRQIFPG